MKGDPQFIIRWHNIFWQPFYFVRKGIYNHFRRLAPRLTGDVLDFGCGSKPYRSLFTSASSYVGVDIQVSGHGTSGYDIEYYYDGKTLPFEASRFDGIFSSEVFEHIFNLPGILPELHRVLKPGGLLLISCPFCWPEHEQPYDFARYSSFAIRHLLGQAGFEIVEQHKTGNILVAITQLILYYNYCFIPKRPRILYLILHQIFMLPIILGTLALNALLPRRALRTDLYCGNIVLARKA